MTRKASIGIRILLAIALFFSGLFFYGTFVSLYLFDEDFMEYESFSPSYQTKHILMFSICLASIPTVSLLLKLKKFKSILISVAIILGFLIFGILIKKLLSKVLMNSSEFEGPVIYLVSLDKVMPELYMIVALIIGYFLLRHLKKEGILFRNDAFGSGSNLVSQP